MAEFFRTRMGTLFYDSTMPRLVRAMESIAGELKRYMDYLEREEERQRDDPSFYKREEDAEEV